MIRVHAGAGRNIKNVAGNNMNHDIYKAGAIIINNKKILLLRAKGKDAFVAPGGKLEKSEDAKSALIRELKEELGITVEKNNLKEFDTYCAPATGDESKMLRMDTYIVKKYQGELKPDNEIKEMLWIDSNIPENVKIGSIFEHEIIPKLKEINLID
jgi:8-oxo-dGTP diphosphatase